MALAEFWWEVTPGCFQWARPAWLCEWVQSCYVAKAAKNGGNVMNMDEPVGDEVKGLPGGWAFRG